MSVHAHQARLATVTGSDTGAPGAAITVALCGSWDHPPPCPLAAHHTDVVSDHTELTVRTVFVADDETVIRVRRRIDAALRAGRFAGPDGAVSWVLLESGPVTPTRDEFALGARLASAGGRPPAPRCTGPGGRSD